MATSVFDYPDERRITRTRPGQEFKRTILNNDNKDGKKAVGCNYKVIDVYPFFIYAWNETMKRMETFNLGDLVMFGLEPDDPFNCIQEYRKARRHEGFTKLEKRYSSHTTEEVSY